VSRDQRVKLIHAGERTAASRVANGVGNVYGKPGGDSGSGVDRDDCKAKFRVAWSGIRARADGSGHREGARDAALTAIIHIAGIRQTSLSANEV
jgi:hypothetical protein